MKLVPVKLYNKSHWPDPAYETTQSAGMDIRANIDLPQLIAPGEVGKIPTGIHVALREGYELQVRPRSGLAAKNNITVMNTPGTIDADYRGEIIVLLYNAGNTQFVVNPGDRIAQMVLNEVPQVVWDRVENQHQLGLTDRGTGGFGSTGV